ncbi:MAG: PEP-CTERM sorting domain-containing protein [Planctomycetes bacterium]|nr:PEP-CTERM sorting domain-containing protein [Planctomycetota bacterium]
MNVREFFVAGLGLAAVLFGSAGVKADLITDVPPYDPSLRPIHWWIGNLENRAQAATADLVASWSYWPLNGVYDVGKEGRRMRLLVGGATSIDAAISGIQQRYAEGFRMLATNHENWSTPTTTAQAQTYVNAINSRPGLSVLQWNHWMTWVDGARPVLAGANRLELVEMAYPTAEGKRTYAEIYNWIMWFVRQYPAGKEPGIGLSVYTGHDSATPIGWELMKTQIDAAKAVGKALGRERHPIGIYISNVQPTEFTVDDVNNYIIFGTRDPIPGDLNVDGSVTSMDLDIVRANWGRQVAPGNVRLGDPSGDGLVGGTDLDIIRNHWGRHLVPVPEPSTLLLLCAGGLLNGNLFVRTRPVRRPRGFHHPGRNLMNPVMTISVVKGRPAS